MDSNQAVSRNPLTELRVQQESLQRDESTSDNELENRIRNMDKLVESTHAALDEESFTNKPHALDLMNDLRVKIKATHKMFQVAKLLSEPARESMFSRVRDSLDELEQVFASHLGVRMS